MVWHVVGCSVFCWSSTCVIRGIGSLPRGCGEDGFRESWCKLKIQLSCDVGGWCLSGQGAWREQRVYKAGSDAQLPRSDVGKNGEMGLEGGAVTWASPLG